MNNALETLYYVEYRFPDGRGNAYYSSNFEDIRANYLTLIEQFTFQSIKLVKLICATDEQIVLMSK